MHTEPPRELADVDRTRLFGLMTTPEVLVGIRQRRLGNAGVVAKSYADPEYVYQDLESARALMRDVYKRQLLRIPTPCPRGTCG